MEKESKTLYIPLYGKAYVSRKGILLKDPKAEEIWAAEGFPLKGKSRSKWLAYYMGMRSAVFDRWLKEKMDAAPDAAVLHLGCGMDSRVCRVGTHGHCWFDVDFPDVIRERRRYFSESGEYRMIGSDLRDTGWLENVPGSSAIVVMEGVSMYLRPEELKILLGHLQERFAEFHLLMDCYSEFAARASRYRNPVNDVGVTEVYGLDDPEILGIPLLREHDMTPANLMDELPGMERTIFRKLYGGAFARKLYRLYEFGKNEFFNHRLNDKSNLL